MKMKFFTHKVVACLFLANLANASVPSEAEIKQIKSRIQTLKENPDSNAEVDALFEDIEKITEDYGIDGVAWVAYQEPILLEAFISPQSMGIENIAVSLLRQAQSEEQLTDMIYALVLAELYAGMDPSASEHIAFFKKGASLSNVTLSDSALEQLIVEAVAAGIETGEAAVLAAHADHKNAIEALEKIKGKLIAQGKLFLLPVIDSIISKLKNHTIGN